MLKFKFNYLKNTLFYQKYEVWRPAEKKFTGNYQAQGFTLEPFNHWISFQVKENNIWAFYKLPADWEAEFSDPSIWVPETITYYRRYLAKEEEIVFEFTETEQVEKIDDKWVKKKGVNHD